MVTSFCLEPMEEEAEDVASVSTEEEAADTANSVKRGRRSPMKCSRF